MARINWKPGNMIFPVPAVLVSCGNRENGYNLITVSWTGTICTNPPMCYISLRKERLSHEIISRDREFVINLSTEKMAKATDWCGVKSGRDFDKFKECGFTAVPAQKVVAPLVGESPVAIECRVSEIKELGSHDMFLAEVLSVSVDDQFLDGSNGAFDMGAAGLIASSHGKYCGLKEPLGHFGYSVKKPKKKSKKPSRKKKPQRS
ncbi:flavin reductase family protein [Oceanispirochaeta crateris]|uniref:Flavin reductase family protein n=1 Tax=Oceanispirochaeta crateris TaxID=2518645 RepID=A0A5C1QQC0_9SPIO|nr:flavin reductase family protein [Oceanispirochaeta crateris]QEN08814.1 flavin reductase family protein [Oceanispirochaeta crateris]